MVERKVVKSKIPTAKEARKLLEKRLPLIRDELLKKKRMEEVKRTQEQKEEDKRIREATERKVFELSKEIGKAIHEGKASLRFSIDGDGFVFREVCAAFTNLGYRVLEQNRQFVEADNGDKDSGEGRHDAYWIDTAVIRWARSEDHE
jgi:hypothetical protein